VAVTLFVKISVLYTCSHLRVGEEEWMDGWMDGISNKTCVRFVSLILFLVMVSGCGVS
jgi:hypothetical protein